VDHCAAEAEHRDAAFQLSCGDCLIGGRQRGKAGEPVRVSLYRFVQPIIRVTRHGNRDVGTERLRARGAEGEDLNVDSCRVHVGEALSTEIRVLRGDVVADLFAPAREIKSAELVRRHVLSIHRRGEVLFDRDRSHFGSLTQPGCAQRE
jgi:hypothetical protein